MDFGLSEEQLLLKDTVRRYLEGECPTTRVRAIMESESGHDADLWRGLADLGVPGLCIPVEHGGAGLELLDAALAAEELGWAAAPGPFLACALATAALNASGNAQAEARWRPGIADGSVIASLALGEAGGEWDAAGLTTRVRAGEITGEKPFVPSAAIADVILVAAQDDEGPSLWLAEGGARGLEVGPPAGTRP